MQIIQNLLIDANGVLREQHQGDKERTTCHTARMRNEYTSSDTLIQLATKLTPELRKNFAAEKFKQWIEWYLAPEYELPFDSDQLHYDVAQITNSVEMQQWWWQEWQNYDLKLSQSIIKSFADYTEIFSKKHLAGVARLLSAHRVTEDYFHAHDQKFSVKTIQFMDLEKSYCQAISKAK